MRREYNIYSQDGEKKKWDVSKGKKRRDASTPAGVTEEEVLEEHRP
jgi:hypothetical protein